MRRVWDSFLTDADRVALAARPPRPEVVFGFGERPALVLVDLYRAVFGDRPEPLPLPLDRWPQSCGLAGWNAVPVIQSVMAAARAASVPVVHVTGLTGSGVASWAGSARRSDARPMVPPGYDPYEIIPELSPEPGEAVIKKLAPSGFFGTLLGAHLQALRIDTIVVCGESTSGCVRATVVDGRSHRFNVIVVEDGVFDRHEATAALNLFDMNEKYADVVSSAVVIDHLGRYSSRAADERPSVPLASSAS